MWFVSCLVGVRTRRDVALDAAAVLEQTRGRCPKLAPTAFPGALNFWLIRIFFLLHHCDLLPLDRIAFGA